MLTTIDIVIQIKRHPVIAKFTPSLPENGTKSFVANETKHILTRFMQNKRKLKEACFLYTVNATQNAYRQAYRNK